MREIRTLRSTWRGLETWLGRGFSTETGAPVPDPTTDEAVAAWKESIRKCGVLAPMAAIGVKLDG